MLVPFLSNFIDHLYKEDPNSLEFLYWMNKAGSGGGVSPSSNGVLLPVGRTSMFLVEKVLFDFKLSITSPGE